MRWLCNEPQHTEKYLLVFCDIMDFGRCIIPMADVTIPPDESKNYLSIARSHLISATTLLAENLGLRGCSQSALLAAEFSLKAVLKSLGKSESDLRRIGHDLERAVDEIVSSGAAINESEMRRVINVLPQYVSDRYSENNLTKTQCGDILVACQFIAGEAARFLTNSSFEEQMNSQDVAPGNQ